MNQQSPILNKSVFSWCLYDWANSAFPSIITTFIFAAYFTQSVAPSVNQGTALWGYTITLSGIFIAVFSPIFGSIADRYGRRKPWIVLFSLIAAVSCFALWWVKPHPSSIPFALNCIIIGTVGFEIAAVFYNAMLHDIVPKDYYGRVSGWGWGLGYIGGLCCLCIALAFAFFPEALHLNAATSEHVRASGPLAALWFCLFAVPLLIFTPDLPRQQSLISVVKTGTTQFWATLKHIFLHERNVLVFLIAHMIYVDGLNTIFSFGGIYAAGTFGLTTKEIILFGIAMNISAGIGAIGFAWLDDWLGAKNTILLAIIGILCTGIPLIFVSTHLIFWCLALVLGLFVGPVQASSRSMLAHIAPKNMVTESFGLFAFSGKATAFVGPWLFGLATLYFGTQRAGMATTIGFVLFGGALLVFVKAKND